MLQTGTPSSNFEYLHEISAGESSKFVFRESSEIAVSSELIELENDSYGAIV